MHDGKGWLRIFTVIAACTTACALATMSAAGQGQGERVTRLAISEQVSPVEPLAPSLGTVIAARGFSAGRPVSDHSQPS